MNMTERFKNILSPNTNTVILTEKISQILSIIESIPITLFLFDNKKHIIEMHNLEHTQKIGISNSTVEVGKYLRYHSTKDSIPFNQTCDAIDNAIEKAIENKSTYNNEYRILNYYFKIIATVKGKNILVQVKDITDIRANIQKLESTINNELLKIISAGGLYSWKYNVEKKLLSFTSDNSTMGDDISLDELLSVRIPPQYKSQVLKLIDDIANQGIEHCEITIRCIDQTGRSMWINIHATPSEYNSRGEVTVIAGSQKDITQEYEYTQKINQLNLQNELILNNINSALVYLTPDYRIVWENISKVFSHTFAKNYYKTGTCCYEAFNRDTPCNSCVMRRAMESKKSEISEYTTPEGVIVELTANPILNHNNEIEGIVLKVDDVTEKKESIKNLKSMEQKASSANQLLSTILDNLPSSIFVKDVDENYRYIIANKELCKKLGLTEKEIIGKTDYDIFPEAEASKYCKDDREVIETNCAKTIEETVTFMDGLIVSDTIKVPLINDITNKKRLLVGMSMDVSERIRAYQELEAAMKKAEESDRLKSAFLANMSHEIRTPLNAIVGFSELMGTCSNEEREEYMRIISTNNELLLRLINDILDLSKLESGIIQFNDEEFDLAQFFTELSSSMRQRLTNPNIKFITENPYKSCVINTDKTRMTQVWQNFLTNAIKYTKSGYIKMGYEHVDEGIKIYVEDSGIGISDQKKTRLFQRFEKLDSFAQGTGLGLSICKAITELGGGKVGCISTEGKGSTFWSWKPLNIIKLEKK